MDLVWITNGSTRVAPVVNPLIAACHDEYVPTDIYILNNPLSTTSLTLRRHS